MKKFIIKKIKMINSSQTNSSTFYINTRKIKFK